MEELPHEIARLGPEVQAWVEKQLIADLGHYGVSRTDLGVDWNDACQEGHVVVIHGRWLESLSSVVVNDSAGNLVAEGWMDFVSTSRDVAAVPVVFWLFLSIAKVGKVKRDAFLPAHVWDALNDEEKRYVCTNESKWLERDPKVQQWKERWGEGTSDAR